jgi:DNA-binding NtrC family response regulator
MTTLLLVGTDAALLEGLSQTFAALGYVPRVATALQDARELAAAEPPLIAVVDRVLAASAGTDALAIPLAPGGALVLFSAVGSRPVVLPATLQRSVLADLALPLERNRLVALVQHVEGRVRATGRGRRNTPPEPRVSG